MRKKTLSLLEVCIGLALTAILLTSLFSGFRHLMQTGGQIKELRHQMQPSLIMQMRLNQIFSSISPESLFYTDTHAEGKGLALYFTFQNGVDPDPEFSGEIDGVFYWNKRDECILKLKEKREETLLPAQSSFQMFFYDPKEKIWTEKWKKNYLPPVVQMIVNHKTYSFFLPKTTREGHYS